MTREMHSADVNSVLNDLLVELHRSLVQYILKASLWSTPGARELQGIVLSLAERQQQDAGRIAVLLMDRWQVIDFGQYPGEFTRMNYVALEFLAEQLCVDQETLVAKLEQSLPDLVADPAAHSLIGEIVASQQAGLDSLQLRKTSRPESGSNWMK